MCHAPSQVIAEVERLHKDSGSVLEHGVRWIPDRWKVPSLAGQSAQIDMIISRSDPGSSASEQVLRRRHVIELQADLVTGFMAVMIWGFGIRGYGPDRVARILHDAGSALPSKLGGLARAACAGAGEAWDALSQTSKLRGLGPAFGTKVAYFASSRSDCVEPRPLIADLNTSWAMWHLAKVSRSVEQRDSYVQYVEMVHRWARHHDLRPDDIEWALFEIGKNVPRKVG